MSDGERANVIRSGRPAVGTMLQLPGIGPATVTSNADPAMVTLETPAGTTLRIGERALAAALDDSDGGPDNGAQAVA